MPTKKTTEPTSFKRFISRSLGFHIALLVFVVYNIDYFIPKISNEKQVKQALEFETEAYRQAMLDNVKDMEQIKEVLDKLLKLESPLDDTLFEDLDSPIDDEQTVLELYEQSANLLKEIESIQQGTLNDILGELDVKQEGTSDNEGVEELARDTGNLAHETSPDDEEGETDGKNDGNQEKTLSAEQMLAEISENKTQAQQILKQIQQHNQNKQSGSSVSNMQTAMEAEKKASGYSSNKKFEDLNQHIDATLYVSEKAQSPFEDFTGQMRILYGEPAPTSSAPSSIDDVPFINPKVRYPSSRKIQNKGSKSDWVALNTWYVVGPFENSNRNHLHHSFSPERNVDLDAKYLGKNNRVIRWQYMQFENIPIVPPDLDQFEIYYAYTELYSDVKQDIWIAVGSDDQSKLWINDIKVWDSTLRHKGWSMTEGMRKVRIKKGDNTLLFRLENGQYGGSFSVLMSSIKNG